MEEALCNVPCAGQAKSMCGGPGVLSVTKSSNAVEPAGDGRPLVCLVMILKNEAHTILSTLQSIKPHVDCWYVMDTGSTDGTQKVVKDYMVGVPGELFESPFVDYGNSRNKVMFYAREAANPVFTLTLSADETVLGGDVMRRFLKDYRHAHGEGL